MRETYVVDTSAVMQYLLIETYTSHVPYTNPIYKLSAQQLIKKYPM